MTKKSGESSTGTVGDVIAASDDGYVTARFISGDQGRRGGKVPAIAIAARYRNNNRYTEPSCHTDGNCSSTCMSGPCPCRQGGWFRCC